MIVLSLSRFNDIREEALPQAKSPQQQLRRIRLSLAALERAANRLVASLNGRPARKLQLSPKRRAQLKLHGRYLGYIRQLKPKEQSPEPAIMISGVGTCSVFW